MACHQAFAECDSVTVPLTPNKTLQLAQTKFADNQLDLALVERTDTITTAMHRITFSSRKNGEVSTCCLQPLLLQKGGNWGWHVIWQAHEILFYLRVDGETWVSSPPKKLALLASQLIPADIKFSINKETITVNWLQPHQGSTKRAQAISDDEGRSWNIAPIQP